MIRNYLHIYPARHHFFTQLLCPKASQHRLNPFLKKSESFVRNRIITRPNRPIAIETDHDIETCDLGPIYPMVNFCVEYDTITAMCGMIHNADAFANLPATLLTTLYLKFDTQCESPLNGQHEFSAEIVTSNADAKSKLEFCQEYMHILPLPTAISDDSLLRKIANTNSISKLCVLEKNYIQVAPSDITIASAVVLASDSIRSAAPNVFQGLINNNNNPFIRYHFLQHKKYLLRGNFSPSALSPLSPYQ